MLFTAIAPKASLNIKNVQYPARKARAGASKSRITMNTWKNYSYLLHNFQKIFINTPFVLLIYTNQGDIMYVSIRRHESWIKKSKR